MSLESGQFAGTSSRPGGFEPRTRGLEERGAQAGTPLRHWDSRPCVCATALERPCKKHKRTQLSPASSGRTSPPARPRQDPGKSPGYSGTVTTDDQMEELPAPPGMVP